MDDDWRNVVGIQEGHLYDVNVLAKTFEAVGIIKNDIFSRRIGKVQVAKNVQRHKVALDHIKVLDEVRQAFIAKDLFKIIVLSNSKA